MKTGKFAGNVLFGKFCPRNSADVSREEGGGKCNAPVLWASRVQEIGDLCNFSPGIVKSFEQSTRNMYHLSTLRVMPGHRGRQKLQCAAPSGQPIICFKAAIAT